MEKHDCRECDMEIILRHQIKRYGAPTALMATSADQLQALSDWPEQGTFMFRPIMCAAPEFARRDEPSRAIDFKTTRKPGPLDLSGKRRGECHVLLKNCLDRVKV